MVSLNQIFNWFKAGLKPTESQFKETFSSFWHKSEKIPQNSVLGLKETIETAMVGLIYQDPVDTVEDLAITYPNPQPGWAAMVTSLGYIYSWNGSAWANTGLRAFPADVATTEDISLLENEINDLRENQKNAQPVVVKRVKVFTNNIFQAYEFGFSSFKELIDLVSFDITVDVGGLYIAFLFQNGEKVLTEWGDGVTNGFYYHEYSTPGTYNVKMKWDNFSIPAMFSDFKKIKNVFISEKISEIQTAAFVHSVVDKINISNVKIFRADCFLGCELLDIDIVINDAQIIERNSFSGCYKVKKAKIQGSVSEIGYGAFSGCITLKEITLPASVQVIGPFCFYGCLSLRDIYIESEVPPSYGDYSFTGPNEYADFKIHVPEGSVDLYKSTWPDLAQFIIAI
jgi:hypothetical protein